MRRLGSLGLVLLLVAASLGILILPAPPAQAAGQVSVYMGGLSWPIALAFASDGRIFFAERLTGNIRIIQGGSLLAIPFYTLTNTATAGERGLLGLALDPGFPATPYVYAYQTYNDMLNGTIYNRIVRITANGNLGVSHIVILRMPPLGIPTNHNGGVIAFGPDGKLYAVVGENANIALAQDLMSPMGKVLRMNTDGSAPVDNPYYGSLTTNNLIYTYGHRNMFGLAWHPATGRPYVTENGPGCNDEVNLLPDLAAADRNFGWGVSQTCASPPPPPQNTNRDGPNPILPIYWWGSTICPTNAAIYGGPFFPAFRGDLFMGDCNFGRFHRLHLVPPSYDTVASDSIVWTAPTSIIEVEQGPDGAIWLTTPSTIYRYWDSATPPTAAFLATPNPTTVGTPVAFDASASNDPDGTIASYAWEFGDAATGSGVTTSHAYAAPGTYRVNLTVADNETYTATTSRDVVVTSAPSPPVASFTASPNPTNPGVLVSFDGTASYDPDGTIVSYSWDFGDLTTGSGPIPTHTYGAAGTYSVVLTVVDDSSMSDTATADIVVEPTPPQQPPIATFFASPNPAGPGDLVTFDASLSNDPDGTIVSYAWDFGDTGTGSGVITSHSYPTPGTYTVTLNVTDNTSLSSEVSGDVIVNAPPRAAIAWSPNVIVADTVVTFDGSGSTDPDGTVVAYAWDFGDTTGGSGPAPTHAYARKGTYTVALTVTDDLGGTNRTTASLVVQNSPPRITSSVPGLGPVTAVAGATRRFTVAAVDPDDDVLSYVWRVDGTVTGGDSVSVNVTRASPGTYVVNVTVSDGSAETWREWVVTVEPEPVGGNVLPWALAFIVIVLAVIGVLILVAWRRRRKEESPPYPPPPPP